MNVRDAAGPATFLPIVKRSIALTWAPDANKGGEVQSDGSSTSAGSGSLASDVTSDEYGLASPVNWRIRNTFLDMPVLKLTVMQGFQHRRRAWSCPAGGREASEREDLVAMEELPPLSDEAPSHEQEAPVVRSSTMPEQNPPRPLALAELVGPQPHSKGSVLHFQGTCKPCAFFWKVVGCKYGTECEFCHLCDADERKRRNKEKRMAMHALQAGGRTHCMGSQPRHSRGSRLSVQGGA